MAIKLKAFKLKQKENYHIMIKLLAFYKADLIVSKNKNTLTAEMKSEKATSIEEMSTKKQLLEYPKVFNNKKFNFNRY